MGPFASLFALCTCVAAVWGSPSTNSAQGVSLSVDLTSLFNNKAASSSPGGADFDGNKGSFPLSQLPTEKTLTYKGINFTLPPWGSSSFDNIVAQGQNIPSPISNSHFQSLHLLSSADGSSTYTNNISITYKDGTLQTQPLLIAQWTGARGVINSISEFTYTATGIDGNASHIQYFEVPLNAGKELASITLPTGEVSGSRLHIFSLSLFTASSLLVSPDASITPGPSLTFQYIRSHNQWFNDSARPSPIEDLAMTYIKPLDTSRNSPDIVQVIEVAISNLPFSSSQTDTKSWLTGQHTVIIQSNHVDTVYAGILNRLRSGDQARVKVGVVNAPGVERGTSTTASAVVLDSHGDVIARSVEFDIVAGIPIYEPTIQSLQVHEAPKWYEDAKIPAFAPSGVQYAEWYWWQQHNPNNTNSPTWVYHKETYGEQFVYDDFIPMFDPVMKGWSPDIFTNLFQEASAGYFVLVTKHHDGFCLFDSQNTTHRSALNYGPKTDLIDSIITSSETLHPNLVPGTYFSLPEWFNPAFAKYGFSSWPGGLAHNAYNWSELEPYTGFIPVEDFITDVQAPQMQILVGSPDGESKGYDSNILWCDIGGPTNVTKVIPDWYNRKYLEGKGVAMDDRCGTWVYDFDTPEYSTYGVVKQDKWESNSGLDPFSYGYNAQTPAANYMNTTTAVHMLVDIVSKNGNWLLDIGPTGNGTVVEPEVTTLRGMGSWLQKAGKALYATDYWFIGPQESSNLRFTTTPLAFYITTLTLPTPSFSIRSPVPILNGDAITLLGGSGEKLKFEVNDDEVIIYVSENEASLVKDAWAFEVVTQSQSTAASSPSTAPSLDPPTPATTHLPIITPDDGNKIISSLGRKISPDMNTHLDSVPSLPSGSGSAKRQKSRSLTLGKEAQFGEEILPAIAPDNRINFISRIFSSYSNGSPVSITPGRKRSSTLPLSSEITWTPQTPTTNASPSDSYHTPTNGSSPSGSLPSVLPSSISGSGRHKRSYLSHTPEKLEGDLNTQHPLRNEDSIRYDHNASLQHDISSPESAALGAISHSGTGVKSQGRSSTIESPLVTAVTTQSEKIPFTPPRTSTPPPLGRSTNSYRRQPPNTYPPRSRSRHTFDGGSRSSILSENPVLFPSFRRMSESLGKIMASPSSSDKARKEKEALDDDVFTDSQNQPSNGTFILSGERRLSADWSSVEAVRGDVGGAESWPSSVSKEMVRLSLKDSINSAGNNELRRTTSSPVKSLATDVDINPKNPTLFGSIGEDRRAFFRAISEKGHAGRRGHKERSSLTQLMTALGTSNGNGLVTNRNNNHSTDGNVSESKSTNAKIGAPTLTRGGGSSIPIVSVTASTPVEPHPPHRLSVMSDPGPGLNLGSAVGSKRKIADAEDDLTTSFLVASTSAPVNNNTNKNSVRSILVTRSESMDRPSDASQTSHAPSSFRQLQSKRIRLSETPPPSQSQSRAASPPRSPPRNRNTSSSPQPSRPGSAVGTAVAVNPRAQSRTSLDSRRHNNRSPSLSESASIPVMAILAPKPPSIDTRHSLNTYHMRDPSLPPSRRQSAVWKGAATRKVLDEDVLGMKSRSSLIGWGIERSLFPLQGWAFVIGFVVFPLWWIAAICPVIWGWGSRWKKRRMGFGDIHLIYTEEELRARETLEYDVAYTWRKRCRIMSILGLIVYVPLIVLIAVLVPRSA